MKKLGVLLLALALVMTAMVPALAEDRVTWPENPEPLTLTLFADCSWLPYDTLDGIIPQWVTEQTGITIDMTKSTDDNQIVLLVASGDLPDLVMTDKSDMFRELSSEDMCYPFDELIAQYVPNWEVPQPEKALNGYYSEDEHYYMLKNYFNTAEEIHAAGTLALNNPAFYYRKDIFDTLGIDTVPTDFDGVMAMLAAVKEKYPDMVPMVFQHRNYSAFSTLVGLNRTMPRDENGNLVHEMSLPQFKDFLSVINQMYRAGYILEENFSYNSDEQMYQHMNNGDGFMFSGYGLDEQVFDAYVKSADPNAQLMLMPLMDNYNVTFGVTGWAGTFISKSCSNPEAAIKLIAWLKDGDNQISSQAGVPGIDWEWDENHVFQALDRYKEAQAAGSVDPTYNPGVSYLLSASSYVSEGIVSYATASENVQKILDESVQRASFSNVVGLVVPLANTDEAIIRTNLSALMTEYFPIVCMSASDEEFEANYTKMMDEAKAIGIDQLNAWLTENYAILCEQFDAE